MPESLGDPPSRRNLKRRDRATSRGAMKNGEPKPSVEFRRPGSSSVPPGVFCLRPERRPERAHPPLVRGNPPDFPGVRQSETNGFCTVSPSCRLGGPLDRPYPVVSTGSGHRLAALRPLHAS